MSTHSSEEDLKIYHDHVLAGHAYFMETDKTTEFFLRFGIMKFSPTMFTKMANVIGKPNAEHIFREQLSYDIRRGRNSYSIESHRPDFSRSLNFSQCAFGSGFAAQLHELMDHADRADYEPFNPDEPDTYLTSNGDRSRIRFNNVFDELDGKQRDAFPQGYTEE